MTDTEPQPTIPGLELPEVHPADRPMVRAAKATLAELARTGAVGARHAVQVQLVISLAQAIDSSSKAYAVAQAAAQLRETMLVLDPPDELGSANMRDRLREFMDAVELAANNGGQP